MKVGELAFWSLVVFAVLCLFGATYFAEEQREQRYKAWYDRGLTDGKYMATVGMHQRLTRLEETLQRCQVALKFHAP